MGEGEAVLAGGEDSECSHNDAVGALTELLGHSVSLIDDEVLVEDLEDLPALQVGHCVVLYAVGTRS